MVFIQAPFEEDVASPSLRRAQFVQYATAHPIKIRISPNTYQIDKRQFLNLRAIPHQTSRYFVCTPALDVSG